MSRRDFVSKERNRRDYGNSSQPEKAGLRSSAGSSVWRKLLSAGRLREVRGAAAVPLRAAPIIGGRPRARRAVVPSLESGGHGEGLWQDAPNRRGLGLTPLIGYDEDGGAHRSVIVRGLVSTSRA